MIALTDHALSTGGKNKRKARTRAAVGTGSMAFSLQHRCDLRNSLAQGETDPLGINYGQGGRWHARR